MRILRRHPISLPVHERAILAVVPALAAILLAACASEPLREEDETRASPVDAIVPPRLPGGEACGEAVCALVNEHCGRLPNDGGRPGTHLACVCNDGLERIDGRCSDIDECAIGSPCAADLTCINTFGGYRCAPNVLTQHNDNRRSGAMLHETELTPAAIRTAGDGFGLLYTLPVHGKVVAQPLYAGGVTIKGRKQPVVFVADMTNHIYAFSAEAMAPAYAGGPPLGNIAPLWDWELYGAARPGSGVRSRFDRIPQNAHTNDTVRGNAPNVITNPMQPVPGAWGYTSDQGEPVGILSTPVIDLRNQALYVVTRNCDNANGIGPCLTTPDAINYYLHKVDITTGTELIAPVAIGRTPHPEACGGEPFDPAAHMNRPALTLSGNQVYVAFGAAAETVGGQHVRYHGWVFAFTTNLNEAHAYCTSPHSTGGGIWQAGMGLASDGESLYFTTGNGDYYYESENLPAEMDQRNQIVRLRASDLGDVKQTGPSGQLWKDMEVFDADLGSSGVLLLPDQPVVTGRPSRQLVAIGKPGILYDVDRDPFAIWGDAFLAFDDLWRTTPCGDAKCIDEIRKSYSTSWDKGPHMHGSPVYWQGPDAAQGRIYAWSEKDSLKLLTYDNATSRLVNPTNVRGRDRHGKEIWSAEAAMPGGILSISANGNTAGSGIVWAVSSVIPGAVGRVSRGAFNAFDAGTLEELWGAMIPYYARFTAPTVANGRVYVATANYQIEVYGRLPDTGGTWTVADQSPPNVFCQGEGLEILKGDFDGDRRTDLLCHDPKNGAIALHYANARGTFGPRTSAMATRWCFVPTSPSRDRLLVGDFNGTGAPICSATTPRRGRTGSPTPPRTGRSPAPATIRPHAGAPAAMGSSSSVTSTATAGATWPATTRATAGSSFATRVRTRRSCSRTAPGTSIDRASAGASAGRSFRCSPAISTATRTPICSATTRAPARSGSSTRTRAG
jgi:hypothetical protein